MEKKDAKFVISTALERELYNALTRICDTECTIKQKWNQREAALRALVVKWKEEPSLPIEDIEKLLEG